jgi:hypothetical protein
MKKGKEKSKPIKKKMGIFFCEDECPYLQHTTRSVQLV